MTSYAPSTSGLRGLGPQYVTMLNTLTQGNKWLDAAAFVEVYRQIESDRKAFMATHINARIAPSPAMMALPGPHLTHARHILLEEYVGRVCGEYKRQRRTTFSASINSNHARQLKLQLALSCIMSDLNEALNRNHQLPVQSGLLLTWTADISPEMRTYLAAKVASARSPKLQHHSGGTSGPGTGRAPVTTGRMPRTSPQTDPRSRSPPNRDAAQAESSKMTIQANRAWGSGTAVQSSLPLRNPSPSRVPSVAKAKGKPPTVGVEPQEATRRSRAWLRAQFDPNGQIDIDSHRNASLFNTEGILARLYERCNKHIQAPYAAIGTISARQTESEQIYARAYILELHIAQIAGQIKREYAREKNKVANPESRQVVIDKCSSEMLEKRKRLLAIHSPGASNDPYTWYLDEPHRALLLSLLQLGSDAAHSQAEAMPGPQASSSSN